METHFAPDAARAVALNARMNRELGESLAHVADRATGEIVFDAVAIDRLVAHLAEGRNVQPSTFGHYYDLVRAIRRQDEAAAQAHLYALARADLREPPLHVVALGDKKLGAASAMYQEKWNADRGAVVKFTTPTAEIATAFTERLEAGLSLVRAALPDLAAEIEAIVHQIVIIGSDPDAKMHADGGSHFQLWGALFLNGHFHPDRIAVAEVLAHETAHSLLFGFCTDEPLTLNDSEARYTSPLRKDQRPMDGIYHATFVSARMHWAMTALAEAEGLDAEERERARMSAAQDGRNFEAGYSVVESEGLLTKTGRALMDNARAYMRTAADPAPAMA